MKEESYSQLIEELTPQLSQWMEIGYIPKEGWKLFGRYGLIGISYEDNGLLNYYTICRKLLSLHNIGLVASYTINEITYGALARYSENQWNDLLALAKQGHLNISLCMTEEQAGSDLQKMSSSAVLKGEHYVLNVKKKYISNAPIADYLILAVNTGKSQIPLSGISIFLIDKNQSNLTISPLSTVGVRLMPLGEIELQQAKVSKKQLLGKENKGVQYLAETMQYERLMISLLALAICEEIYSDAIKHVQNRELFGKKLKDFQYIKFEITEYFSRIKMLKAFLLELIRHPQTKENKHDVLLAKIQSTQLLSDIASTVPQWFGGSGYVSDHWVSNLYNDVRWTKIAGGSNELLCDSLGNHLVNTWID